MHEKTQAKEQAREAESGCRAPCQEAAPAQQAAVRSDCLSHRVPLRISSAGNANLQMKQRSTIRKTASLELSPEPGPRTARPMSCGARAQPCPRALKTRAGKFRARKAQHAPSPGMLAGRERKHCFTCFHTAGQVGISYFCPVFRSVPAAVLSEFSAEQ